MILEILTIKCCKFYKKNLHKTSVINKGNKYIPITRYGYIQPILKMTKLLSRAL